MPRPRSVTIAGKLLPEIEGVNISIHTPYGPRGDYDGRTSAATITLTRRAVNTPTMEMFKSATNDDGHLEIISGKIELESARKQPTYTFDLEEAFICDWSFHQADGDTNLWETIVLKVGKMKISGGGSSKSFQVHEFNRIM